MFFISVWTVLSTCEYFECTIESVLQSSRPGIGLEAPRGHIFMASALRAVLTYLVTHATTRSIYTSWKSKIINKLITMYIYISSPSSSSVLCPLTKMTMLKVPGTVNKRSK